MAQTAAVIILVALAFGYAGYFLYKSLAKRPACSCQKQKDCPHPGKGGNPGRPCPLGKEEFLQNQKHCDGCGLKNKED